MIGARPHTEWLPADIDRDDAGFIVTGPDLPEDRAKVLGHRPLPLETSLPGVLAAGDVRHGSVRRVASAVGEGSAAIQSVHRILAAGSVPVKVPMVGRPSSSARKVGTVGSGSATRTLS